MKESLWKYITKAFIYEVSSKDKGSPGDKKYCYEVTIEHIHLAVDTRGLTVTDK